MGPIVNANCKVTPGTAFDNKTNDSLYQYDYTPSSTKEILTWTKAKICLPSPSRRSPYSIFTHTSDLLLYFFFLCLMFGFLHLIWFIETRGDGFSTRGEPVCFFFFFFLCLMFGFLHLICSILVLVVMSFQPVVMKFTSFTFGFSDPC